MTNWFDLVPEQIAERKRQYDRRRLMWDMRRAGNTFHAIAEKFGISDTGARRLVEKFHHELGRPDPIEDYLRPHGDAAAIRGRSRWKFLKTLERLH